jgi:hypothetical protein
VLVGVPSEKVEHSAVIAIGMNGNQFHCFAENFEKPTLKVSPSVRFAQQNEMNAGESVNDKSIGG